jgi:hypothetical protein
MLNAGSRISAMEKLLESDASLFSRRASKVLVLPFMFNKITPYVRCYDTET